jgi:hypothetical protein
LDQVYYSGAQDVLHLSYSLSPVVNDYLSQVSLPERKTKTLKELVVPPRVNEEPSNSKENYLFFWEEKENRRTARFESHAVSPIPITFL